MKRLLMFIGLILSVPVWAQGSVEITADTAIDVYDLAAFGPGRAVDVAFSPDGKIIAVATSIGVKVFEVGAFSVGDLLDNDGFSASAVAFAPDAKTVMAVNNGYNIREYSIASGDLLLDSYPPSLTDSFDTIAYNPLGTSYSVNTGETLTAIDAITGETLFASPGHIGRITNIAYSTDGTRIATASYDMTVNIWDALTGAHLVTLTGHTDKVTAAVFSPDGTQIVTASHDGTARIWDATTGAELNILAESEGGFGAVAVAPNGTIALGSVNGTVSLNSGTETILGTHNDLVTTLAFSPDGAQLASSSSSSVRLWDVLSLSEAENAPFEPALTTLAVNPDGSRLAAGGINGITYIFDTATGEIMLKVEAGIAPVSGLAFDPASDTLYIASADSRVIEVNAQTGEIIGDLESTAPIIHIAQHPSIAMINGVMSDGSLRWWNTQNGEIFGTSAPHAASPTTSVYSPDGAWMASADINGQIFIWSVETGDFLNTLDDAPTQVNDMAFTSDGEILAAALANGQVLLWRLAEPLDPFLIISDVFFSQVTAVAFSRDNTVLAAASLDGTVHLFNPATGTEYKVLYEQGTAVLDLIFSPDSTRIYSVGDGGSVVLRGILQ